MRGSDEIAVIGAGLAGLTAALRLAEAGLRVRVFERYPRPGGLARVLEIGGEPIEAFYHHIFTTDTAYVELAEELGLGHLIDWLPSRMGIWTDGRLWDFGTPVSLLRFRPLSLLDKIRFALSTLLLQRRHDPQRFENVTAAEWIRRHQGERTWRTVWGPLLYQKFAGDAERVAMVWLWGKLYLRGRSRSASGMGERLGYMRGSFAVLTEAIEKRLAERGVTLHLSDPVKRVDSDGRGFTVSTQRDTWPAARVVVAAPVPDYLAVAGHLLQQEELRRLSDLRATGAICTILELRHSLIPFYWLNIADPEMPFGGLIEHTNYITPERYGGRRILYISNYLFPDHPLFRAPKKEVLAAYLPALARVNPAFDPSWIVASHHFRADYAQPVVTVGYRRHIPALRASAPGLYLCSMAQIFPEDRGQNYAIVYGNKVSDAVLQDIEKEKMNS
ncbi:MAG: NAD(P)/FAD-dependent oxidoreductase [Thermoanaerobaculales bacterium]